MKDKIKKIMKIYHLKRYIIAAILLLFITLIISIVSNFYDDAGKLFSMLILPLMWMIWSTILLLDLRQTSYKIKTGRNFLSDTLEYQRSYHHLIQYFQNADPYKMDMTNFHETNWRKVEGIILGKNKDGHIINVPSGRDGRIYAILGLPGSGKTSGQIIMSAIRFSGSVFCIDTKGDIESVTHNYRKIKCFNLMDPQHSCHYNPFAGIERLSIDDRCNMVENIGFNLIPQNVGSETTYFRDGANDFWNGITLYLLNQDIHTSFPQVIDAILTSDPFSWIRTVTKSNCIEAQRRLSGHYGENEKNLSGCWSNLCTACRKYASKTLYLLLGNNPKYDYISPQNLEEGIDCYIRVDASDLRNYASVLSLLVQQFLNSFQKRDYNPNATRLSDGTLTPILFILDEFAQLSTLSYDAIASAFMTLRSRNISIFIALQSLSSLTQMFHSSEASKSLIDCISTFSFLNIQEVSTRQWVSQLIGQHKILRASTNTTDNKYFNTSSGKSIQELTEPIIQPAELGNLIDKTHGRDELIIYSQGKYTIADKIYWFNP